jgi:hypothetical protein
VSGTPLARHSIDAFLRFSPSPVICIVGYRYAEVSAALGTDNIYVRSDDPAGGTAFAAFEAFSVPALAESDPLLIVTMGDRIVPSSVFRHLWETHGAGPREAGLTFLTAEYEPPKNRGKGRVLRDGNRRVLRRSPAESFGKPCCSASTRSRFTCRRYASTRKGTAGRWRASTMRRTWPCARRRARAPDAAPSDLVIGIVVHHSSSNQRATPVVFGSPIVHNGSRVR